MRVHTASDSEGGEEAGKGGRRHVSCRWEHTLAPTTIASPSSPVAGCCLTTPIRQPVTLLALLPLSDEHAAI